MPARHGNCLFGLPLMAGRSRNNKVSVLLRSEIFWFLHSSKHVASTCSFGGMSRAHRRSELWSEAVWIGLDGLEGTLRPRRSRKICALGAGLHNNVLISLRSQCEG